MNRAREFEDVESDENVATDGEGRALGDARGALYHCFLNEGSSFYLIVLPLFLENLESERM